MQWKSIVFFNLTLTLLLFISKPIFASTPTTSCHPKANHKLAQYIIAYGSLMETHSKNTTDNSSGENYPVLIDHYQRGWFAKGLSTGFSTTYLGIIKKANAHFNGSIFRLASPASLKNYDCREKYYCRVSVDPRDIHLLNRATQKLPQAQFWVYELKPEFFAQPSIRYPIIESYVDLFLAGCLELEEKFHLQNFAVSCIATTSDWSWHWVNDRIYPRRPTLYQPKANAIDALLKQQLPKQFKQIQLESR